MVKSGSLAPKILGELQIKNYIDFHENIPIIIASNGPWMRKIIFLLLGLFLLIPGVLARDWYVRPAGGSYGSENGTSYANAWDGLLNVRWGTGGVQPGDTLWVCGLHIHEMVSKGYVATQAQIPVLSLIHI